MSSSDPHLFSPELLDHMNQGNFQHALEAIKAGKSPFGRSPIDGITPIHLLFRPLDTETDETRRLRLEIAQEIMAMSNDKIPSTPALSANDPTTTITPADILKSALASNEYGTMTEEQKSGYDNIKFNEDLEPSTSESKEEEGDDHLDSTALTKLISNGDFYELYKTLDRASFKAHEEPGLCQKILKATYEYYSRLLTNLETDDFEELYLQPPEYIFRIIFAAGIPVNTPVNDRNNTLIHDAAYYGSTTLILYLLKFNLFDPKSQNSRGKTPLTAIILHSEYADIMELNVGSLINLFFQEPPLSASNLNSQLEAKMDTCSNLDFFHMDQFGQRPLTIAASSHQVSKQVLSKLIKKELKIEIELELELEGNLDFRATPLNFTALMRAVKSGNIDFAIMLIEAGANPFLVHQPDNASPYSEFLKYCDNLDTEIGELATLALQFFKAVENYLDAIKEPLIIRPFLETNIDGDDDEPMEFMLPSIMFPINLLNLAQEKEETTRLERKFADLESPFESKSNSEKIGITKFDALKLAIQTYNAYDIAQILDHSDPGFTTDQWQEIGLCFYTLLKEYHERFQDSLYTDDLILKGILPIFKVIFNAQFGLPKDLWITRNKGFDSILLKDTLLSLFNKSHSPKEHDAIQAAYNRAPQKICDKRLQAKTLRLYIEIAIREEKVFDSERKVTAEKDLLFWACKIYDTQSIERLLKLGWPVDHIHTENTSRTQTPLLKLLTFVLNHKSYSPLTGNVVKIILREGANPYATDENGNTAFTLAAASSYLVFKHFDLSSVPHKVLLPLAHHFLVVSPLYAALQSGNYINAERLLELNPAQLLWQNPINGLTPLHLLCMRPTHCEIDRLESQLNLLEKIIAKELIPNWHVEAYYPLKTNPALKTNPEAVTPDRLLYHYFTQLREETRLIGKFLSLISAIRIKTAKTETETETETETDLTELIAQKQFFKILQYCKSAATLKPDQYSQILAAIYEAYDELKPIDAPTQTAQFTNNPDDLIFMALQMRIPIDAQDKNGNTLSHIAAQFADDKTLEALIDLNHFSDLKNVENKTPFELIVDRNEADQPLIFEAIDLFFQAPELFISSIETFINEHSDFELNEISNDENALIYFLRKCIDFEQTDKVKSSLPKFRDTLSKALSLILSTYPNQNHIDRFGFKAIDYAAKLDCVTLGQFHTIKQATTDSESINPANYDTTTIAVRSGQYNKARNLLRSLKTLPNPNPLNNMDFFSTACALIKRPDLCDNLKAFYQATGLGTEEGHQEAQRLLDEITGKITKWNKFMHWLLHDYKLKVSLRHQTEVHHVDITTAMTLLISTQEYLCVGLLEYIKTQSHLKKIEPTLLKSKEFVKCLTTQPTLSEVVEPAPSKPALYYVTNEPNFALFALAIRTEEDPDYIAIINAIIELDQNVSQQTLMHGVNDNMQERPYAFFHLMASLGISIPAAINLDEYAQKSQDDRLKNYGTMSFRHTNLYYILSQNESPELRAKKIKKALSLGADINCLDSSEITILHHAVLSSDFEIIPTLLEAKADLNLIHLRSGETPFSILCKWHPLIQFKDKPLPTTTLKSNQGLINVQINALLTLINQVLDGDAQIDWHHQVYQPETNECIYIEDVFEKNYQLLLSAKPQFFNPTTQEQINTTLTKMKEIARKYRLDTPPPLKVKTRSSVYDLITKGDLSALLSELNLRKAEVRKNPTAIFDENDLDGAIALQHAVHLYYFSRLQQQGFTQKTRDRIPSQDMLLALINAGYSIHTTFIYKNLQRYSLQTFVDSLDGNHPTFTQQFKAITEKLEPTHTTEPTSLSVTRRRLQAKHLRRQQQLAQDAETIGTPSGVEETKKDPNPKTSIHSWSTKKKKKKKKKKKSQQRPKRFYMGGSDTEQDSSGSEDNHLIGVAETKAAAPATAPKPTAAPASAPKPAPASAPKPAPAAAPVPAPKPATAPTPAPKAKAKPATAKPAPAPKLKAKLAPAPAPAKPAPAAAAPASKPKAKLAPAPAPAKPAAASAPAPKTPALDPRRRGDDSRKKAIPPTAPVAAPASKPKPVAAPAPSSQAPRTWDTRQSKQPTVARSSATPPPKTPTRNPRRRGDDSRKKAIPPTAPVAAPASKPKPVAAPAPSSQAPRTWDTRQSKQPTVARSSATPPPKTPTRNPRRREDDRIKATPPTAPVAAPASKPKPAAAPAPAPKPATAPKPTPQPATAKPAAAPAPSSRDTRTRDQRQGKKSTVARSSATPPPKTPTRNPRRREDDRKKSTPPTAPVVAAPASKPAPAPATQRAQKQDQFIPKVAALFQAAEAKNKQRETPTSTATQSSPSSTSASSVSSSDFASSHNASGKTTGAITVPYQTKLDPRMREDDRIKATPPTTPAAAPAPSPQAPRTWDQRQSKQPTVARSSATQSSQTPTRDPRMREDDRIKATPPTAPAAAPAPSPQAPRTWDQRQGHSMRAGTYPPRPPTTSIVADHAGHPVYPVHPMHPVHPVHPMHPMHPVHPVHPVHPLHPVHPVHPVHPGHYGHPGYPGYPAHYGQPMHHWDPRFQSAAPPQPQFATPIMTATAPAPAPPKVWSIDDFEAMEKVVSGGMSQEARLFPLWLVATKTGLTDEDLKNPAAVGAEYLCAKKGFEAAKLRLLGKEADSVTPYKA